MAGAWQAGVLPEVLDDLQHWMRHDPRTARRLLELMRAILKEPFNSIGKPEPFNYLGADVWSWRITQEHRCVYLVQNQRVEFLQGRYHY
jgi:toxin YoeB